MSTSVEMRPLKSSLLKSLYYGGSDFRTPQILSKNIKLGCLCSHHSWGNLWLSPISTAQIGYLWLSLKLKTSAEVRCAHSKACIQKVSTIVGQPLCLPPWISSKNTSYKEKVFSLQCIFDTCLAFPPFPLSKGGH